LTLKAQAAEQTRLELLAEAEASKQAALAAANGPNAGQAGAAGTSGAQAKAGAPVWDPRAEGQKFLNTFPQARALSMQVGAATALRIFAPFMRAENLTPGQIEQFENLVASTWTNNLAVTPTQIGAVVGTPTLDQLSQVVGDQGAEAFEAYEQSMRYPYQFTAFAATAASLAGTPLSDAQNDQIAQIIANNTAPYQTVTNTLGPANWNAAAGAVNWNAAIAQVQAALPPAQFDAVQGELQRLQLNGAAGRAQQNQAQANP